MSNVNLKMCENPECFKWLTGNAKRHCDWRCKNRKNYIFQRLQYWYEYMCQSARKKNYMILERLLGINRIFVSREVLEAMGFSFDVCFSPEQDTNGDSYFRFGNSYLKLIDTENFEILYIDNEKIN